MMDDTDEQPAQTSGLTVQVERMRMKKKGSGPSQPQRLFTAEEEELLNSLQRNQILAKERKLMQKKARRQLQDAGMAEEDEPMMTNDIQLPDDEDEDL